MTRNFTKPIANYRIYAIEACSLSINALIIF